MSKTLTLRKTSVSFEHSDIKYKGWLKKQGGRFRNMRRRYFVLVGKILYYFGSANMSAMKGQINISKLELSVLDSEQNGSDYTFYILPEKGKDVVTESHPRYMLAASDKTEAEAWIYHLKQAIYLQRGGGLFGVPLTAVQPFLLREFEMVPRIVHECCQFVRRNCMDEEGIFRKNGQKSEVARLKARSDRGDYEWIGPLPGAEQDIESDNTSQENGVTISEEQDCGACVHDVCSLLKLYLRELPEPLVPFRDYGDLKAVGYRIEANEGLELVSNKLQKLPAENLQLLLYLCRFLYCVSENPANRMSVSSLATVFAPNVLRDQDTDPYVEETTSNLISTTVGALIKRHDVLFNFPITFPAPPPFSQSEDCKEKTEVDDNIVAYTLPKLGSSDSGGSSCINDDTFSVASTVSMGNLTVIESGSCLPDVVNRRWTFVAEDEDDCQGGPLSTLTGGRVSSSGATVCRRSSGTEIRKSTDTTPLASKKKMKPDQRASTEHSCLDCESLKRRLEESEREREKMGRQLQEQTKHRWQLENEMETLRDQLQKVTMDKGSGDLSDLLRHFNMEAH